ncbi:MAG TPA: Cj0069 family protein [Caulobacteraceae bacterium]|jgi:hypothetical protein
MTAGTSARIALLWRGDREARTTASAQTNRLSPIFQALADLGAIAEPAVYSEEMVGEVRAQLLRQDGVLVWVDPISDGRDRSQLDGLLREVAARGVWVSADPDVILKMGVKEVLHRTKGLGWGSDTHLYATPADFKAQFPVRLATAGPRVLKQNRGNGGNGVWKVELIDGADAADAGSPVQVLHALRGSQVEQLRLGEFMDRCQPYFAGAGRLIDQAFQPGLPDGMVRCYLSQATVVGFGHQLIKALIPPPPESAGPEAGLPGPRIMHPPDAPTFQALKALMEGDWVATMQRLLDIDTASLPVLWDADFLYGPKTATGQDTYVLCEINVSAVAPFPDSAAAPVAQAALACIGAERRGR